MINYDDYDDDESPTHEKIHRNHEPVNDGHAFKRGAENRKNRAFKTLRRLKEQERNHARE